MNTADVFDPITAHLAMYMDMINDAEHDLTVRLNSWQAHGYLQALYDLKRIQAGTYGRHKEEIERLREASPGCVGQVRRRRVGRVTNNASYVKQAPTPRPGVGAFFMTAGHQPPIDWRTAPP